MSRSLIIKVFEDSVVHVYKKYGIIPISITFEDGRFVVRYTGCEGMLDRISEDFRSKLPKHIEQHTMIVCVGY